MLSSGINQRLPLKLNECSLPNFLLQKFQVSSYECINGLGKWFVSTWKWGLGFLVLTAWLTKQVYTLWTLGALLGVAVWWMKQSNFPGAFQRKRENIDREKERISSGLPAEHRAWCRAGSHDLEIMTRAAIKSWTLNWVSHPGAPNNFLLWLVTLFMKLLTSHLLPNHVVVMSPVFPVSSSLPFQLSFSSFLMNILGKTWCTF